MNIDCKELARRWFDEVWNKRNLKIVPELLAPTVTGSTEVGLVQGPDHFISLLYAPMVNAFPDLRIQIEDVIGEGDQVVTRWTITATHTGPLLSIVPSQRKFSFSGMTWLRFRDGRIVEGWDRYNLHALIAYLSSGEPSGTVSPVA